MPLNRNSIDSAVNAIDAYTESKQLISEQGKNDEAETKLKSINTRYPLNIYNAIGEVAGKNGLSRADFCRKASIWMLKEVKGGRIDISGGVIMDKRR
jgi:hypothetical protein